MKIQLDNSEFIEAYNKIDNGDRKYSKSKLNALNEHIEEQWENDSDYPEEMVFSSVEEVYNEFRILTIKEATTYFNMNEEDISFLDEEDTFEDYEILNSYVNNKFLIIRLAVSLIS